MDAETAVETLEALFSVFPPAGDDEENGTYYGWLFDALEAGLITSRELLDLSQVPVAFPIQ